MVTQSLLKNVLLKISTVTIKDIFKYCHSFLVSCWNVHDGNKNYNAIWNNIFSIRFAKIEITILYNIKAHFCCNEMVHITCLLNWWWTHFGLYIDVAYSLHPYLDEITLLYVCNICNLINNVILVFDFKAFLFAHCFTKD